MTDTRIRVDPEHFEYLRLQKGSLDHLTKTAGGLVSWNSEWHAAYEADLAETFRQIAPHLPAACWQLLDVGSGLGGIDVLIRRHYEAAGQKIGVALLDGFADLPVMNVHRETFNDMRIARNFQVKNGLSPLTLTCYAPAVSDFDQSFDLVVSFGSWCFHYPPAQYLARVYRAMSPGAVAILDVRRGKSDWLRDLIKAFQFSIEIATRPKWSRFVFRKGIP